MIIPSWMTKGVKKYITWELSAKKADIVKGYIRLFTSSTLYIHHFTAWGSIKYIGNIK